MFLSKTLFTELLPSLLKRPSILWNNKSPSYLFSIPASYTSFCLSIFLASKSEEATSHPQPGHVIGATTWIQDFFWPWWPVIQNELTIWIVAWNLVHGYMLMSVSWIGWKYPDHTGANSGGHLVRSPQSPLHCLPSSSSNPQSLPMPNRLLKDNL